jgi:hypothetical protein
MSSNLSSAARIHRRSGMLTAGLGAGVAILDVQTGRYLSFNESAAAIWTLLEEPRRPDEIVAALRAEYDVDEQTCAAQVEELVAQFVKDGLAEIEGHDG